MSRLSRIALWVILFGGFCRAVFLLPDDPDNPYAILCLIGFGCLLLGLASWPGMAVHQISFRNFRGDYVALARKMPPLALALSVSGMLCLLLGGVSWLAL